MYHQIVKRQKSFGRLSGVSFQTFHDMVHIVSEYRKNQEETRWRNHSLSIENQVLLTLIYMRAYTTFLFLGAIFNTSEATAWRTHREIESILLASWQFSLPKRTLLQEQMEEILIDATESPIERPKKKQRQNYSGKKKRHTLKTQVVQNKQWKILRIHTTNGKTHDKKLYDQSELHIHPKTQKRMDSGYQWVQEQEQNVILPEKWSKLHPLTKEQKLSNREKAKKRIYVEHTMCRIKRFKIVALPYRNRRSRFWLRMNFICWILNYELELSTKQQEVAK